MTLVHRRILYLSFFLVFFLTAPLVLLWAQGYRYNFSKHKWQETGVLFLESKPGRAEIYLNGKLQKEKTTARLKNLLPDEYQVEIKKEGYQSWQKTLEVFPGKTTSAQYIRLFKQNPSLKNIAEGEIILTSEVRDNFFAFIYQKEGTYALLLFNLENQELTPLIDLNFKPDEILLSPKGLFIALKQDKKIFILGRQNSKLFDLKIIIKDNATYLHWSAGEKDDIIYTGSKQGLARVNLMARVSTLLFNRAQTMDFYPYDNEIFFLEKSRENISLYKTTLNNLTSSELLTTLPSSEGYKFFPSSQDLLTLLDEKNQILYLIKTNSDTPQDKINTTPYEDIVSKCEMKVFPATSYVKWLGNELIIFGNSFEILTYEPKKDEKNLIVRLSSVIKKTLWYPIATHLIYLTNEAVNIIELPQPQRNLQTLIQKPNIKDVFINSKGDKIYFIDENGLNVAEIQ